MRPAPVIHRQDDPVVLIAHGSRDPRAAVATRALARAVAAARPGLAVYDSYLDHTAPDPARVLQELATAGHRRATVVPLLLTAAYHGRVDIPGALAAARQAGLRLPVRLSDVLGPVGGRVDAALLAGLRRRLAEAVADPAVAAARATTGGPAGEGPGGPTTDGPASDETAFDAVVLVAAGTRDAVARQTVEQVATALGAALGLPCLAAYASAAPPTAGEAVTRLRAAGARRVAVAAYFLAPGRLYETAMASARGAGAVAFATALEAAPELARLVLARIDAAAITVADDADPRAA